MWNTGDRVLAHRPPGNFWYPAVIRHIDGQRFFVIFDDGEDGFVQAKQMMKLDLEIGDQVFARKPPSKEYRPARIIDKMADQVQVRFRNGSHVWTGTGTLRIQPETLKKIESEEAEEAGEAEESHSWKVGQRVWACWFDLFWYPGIVLQIEADQVKVLFDHGSAGTMAPNMVRSFQVQVGDRLQGRWQAGNEFYDGKIDSLDGEMVHIHYDDDDEETTSVRLLRLKRDDWLPEMPPSELAEGDRILAQWFDGFWYPGIILSVEGKRVHALFDDNDQAYLTWDKVRNLNVGVGERIFCRWKGGPYYLPGEIIQKDGERIRVHFEDGQEEWTNVRLLRLEQ